MNALRTGLVLSYLLAWLNGCAVYKVESHTAQGLIPESPQVFTYGRNRESYQASVSLAVLGGGDRTLHLGDTLKFDSSGRVMEHPRRPAGQLVNPAIRLENQPALMGLSLIRRYDHWSWRGLLQVAPTDMELVNAGAGFGYSRNLSRLFLAASVDWIRNRIREFGVYHEHAPSHTDLEGLYFQRAIRGMAWGSTWGFSLGGLFETGSRIDPYFRASWQAYDVFSADNPAAPAFAYRHAHYQAGVAWEPIADMPMEFSLGMSVPDSRTGGDPALSAGFGLARRWTTSGRR